MDDNAVGLFFWMCMREAGVSEEELAKRWEQIDTSQECFDSLFSAGLISAPSKDARVSDLGHRMLEDAMDMTDAVSESAFERESKAFRMELAFRFWELTCTRILIVPQQATFEEFHTMIQATMNWLNYHLYDFSLERDGTTYEISPGQDEYGMLDMFQAFAGAQQKKSEWRSCMQTRLHEFFPEVSECVYTYDYGDDWTIAIRCAGETTLQGFFPTLEGGEGDAPPDDVGGEYGFKHFLRIYDDPDDSEHEETVAWGVSQGFEHFDPDTANLRLAMWRSFGRRGNDDAGYGSLDDGLGGEEDMLISPTNEGYYADFAAMLVASGLKDATIENHLENARLFLGPFLGNLDGGSMSEDVLLALPSFGAWYVSSVPWASKTNLKSMGTTLRKLYGQMRDKGRVSADDYRKLCAILKQEMDGWVADLERELGGYWGR